MLIKKNIGSIYHLLILKIFYTPWSSCKCDVNVIDLKTIYSDYFLVYYIYISLESLTFFWIYIYSPQIDEKKMEKFITHGMLMLDAVLND